MLDAKGQLGGDRIELAGGQFAVGDRVVLKLNDRRLEIENGNRGRVVAIDGGAGTLCVERSDGKVISLPRAYLDRKTARGDPALVHGYAGTAHIAQGMTTAALSSWGPTRPIANGAMSPGRALAFRPASTSANPMPTKPAASITPP